MGAVLFLALLAIAFGRFGIHTRGPWANDQGVKQLQVDVLLESGFGALAFPETARDLDPDGTWSPLPRMFTWEHEGRRYCVFSWLHAVLVAACVSVVGAAGTFLVPVSGVLLAAWATGRIARRCAPRTPGWVAPVLVALATPLGFYAFVLWEHALSVGLLLAGFEAHLRGRERGSRLAAAWPGLAVGVSFGLRPETIVLAPAFAAGMLVLDRGARRWIVSYAAGLVLSFVPLLLVNQRLFGAALGPDLALHYTGLENRSFLAHLWELRSGIAAAWLADGGTRLWPLLAGAVVAVAVVSRGRRAAAWLLPLLAAAAVVAVVAPRPNDLHKDLWGAAPVVLLALFARARTTDRARDAAHRSIRDGEGAANVPRSDPSDGRLVPALWTAILVYLAGVVATAPNDGGAQWGARYLLPIVPLLLVLGLGSAETWLARVDGVRRVAAIAGLAVLCGVSLFVQARGFGVLVRTTRDGAELLRTVRDHSTDVIVADSGFVCHLLGSLHFERRLLLAESPASLRDLSRRLRDRGVARWTYVAGMPWGKPMALEDRAGLRCDPVAFVDPYKLFVFDCGVAPGASD